MGRLLEGMERYIDQVVQGKDPLRSSIVISVYAIYTIVLNDLPVFPINLRLLSLSLRRCRSRAN